MSMRPVLKWLAVVTGVVPVLMLLLLLVVLYSETVAKSLWSLAGDSVDGLSAGELSGRLAGPLSIRNLHYSTDELTIDVASVGLDWRLERLAFGELYISTLTAHGIRIHSQGQPSPEQDKPFKLPDSLPLPVIVRLADARLRELHFQSGDAEPLRLDAVRMRGQVGSTEVFIEQLSMDGPQLELTARANTQLWNKYKTDANISWRYALPDVASTSGSLKVNGDLDDLSVALRADADDTQYGNYELTLKALANRHSVHISEAILQQKNTDTFLSAYGELDLHSSVPEVDLHVDWHNLQWPVRRDPDDLAQVSSQRGNLLVQGSLDRYTATLDGDISTPQVPQGSIRLAANGDQTHLHISSFKLQALRGLASGQALLDWNDEFASSFQLSGAGLDPGELFPQWPGTVNFKIQGNQKGESVDIAALNADGIVRGHALTLKASGRYDGSIATVPGIRLRSGKTRLDASGTIGKEMDFKWDLDSSDVSSLLPGARGQLSSTGRLSGALATSLVNASVRARDFHYDSYSIGSIDANAFVDLGSQSESTLALSAQSVLIAGNQIRSLQLDGSGRPDKHSLGLKASTEVADVDLQLQGSLQEERWLGRLLGADVSPARLDAWTLKNAVDLTVSAQQQSISRACWVAGISSICVQGNRLVDAQQSNTQKAESSAQFSVQDFSLTYLKPFIPADIEFSGTLAAEGEFQQASDQQWVSTARIETSPMTVTAIGVAGEQRLELLATAPGRLLVNGSSNEAKFSVRLPFADSGGIDGEVTALQSAQGLSTAQLDGGLTLDSSSLDVIAAFVPELKTLQGKLSAAVDFSGSVAKPEVTGRLSMLDGLAELATPGVLINDITLTANTKRPGEFVYTGSAMSDSGRISLEGNSVLGGDTTSTEFTVKGNDFQLWNTAEARVWVSPDVSVIMQGERVKVQGKLGLPKARITPQELPSGAVDVSSDQIIVRTDDDKERTNSINDALQVSAAVDIELGDDVTVEGFGFKGAIAGELGVRQRPGKPLVASGELNIVDGEYRAYGQGLVIDRGQVLFAGGAIDNPGLSVRALRRPAEGIVVGVNVRGELRQPELSLFSEPSMSQSDQLSWLVLGRPLQNASGAETDYITQAALALGIRGGNSVAKGIGDTLGVDTFAIQTGSGEAGAASDVNQAALVIGKYLTPKLYVSYGVGLLDAVNTVKLRYLMTDRWNLETESSAISSGGDISYSFEK